REQAEYAAALKPTPRAIVSCYGSLDARLTGRSYRAIEFDHMVVAETVQLCGASRSLARSPHHRLDQPQFVDLTPEPAVVQSEAEHRFVGMAQSRQGERWRQQEGGKRGISSAPSAALHRLRHDGIVVERKPFRLVQGQPFQGSV